MRRFTELDREEVRRMFQLHDLRESKVWQEAEKVGQEKGRQKDRKTYELEALAVKGISERGANTLEIRLRKAARHATNRDFPSANRAEICTVLPVCSILLPPV
jgi:predicted transposase YdaD